MPAMSKNIFMWKKLSGNEIETAYMLIWKIHLHKKALLLPYTKSALFSPDFDKEDQHKHTLTTPQVLIIF